MTIQSVVDEFLHHLTVVKRRSSATVEAYRSDLHSLIKTLENGGNTEVGAITVKDINRWISLMQANATNTVRRRLSALSSFFRVGMVLEYVQENPVDRIERPSAKRRIQPVPTKEEVQRLLDCAPTHQHRTIILLLATTGLRRGELMSLRVGDATLADRRITVQGKGDKQRQVIITAELARSLSRHLAITGKEASPTSPLFAGQKGGPLCKSTLQRWFDKWLKASGLHNRRYTLHSLRRYAGTHWLRAGLNIRQIQILLGHEDPQTTAQYLDYDLEMIEQDMTQKVPPVDESLQAATVEDLAPGTELGDLPQQPAQVDQRTAAFLAAVVAGLAAIDR